MIHNAIRTAYEHFQERGWDKIYVALDVHGTIANPDYHSTSTELYGVAVEPLRVISKLPEVEIILFTCCYPAAYQAYLDLLRRYDIDVVGINANPVVANTVTGCFDQKWYFNILIDDKAGFEPWLWPSVRDAFLNARQFNRRVKQLQEAVPRQPQQRVSLPDFQQFGTGAELADLDIPEDD